MVSQVPNFHEGGSGSFQKISDAFLAGEGLPFAGILSAERIERVFVKHGCLFGRHGIYTSAIMVWSFLSQVLRDGKEASCQAAVARVVSYCQQAEITVPTSDTGDYCRARAKLSEAVLHELSCEVSGELENQAEKSWLWKGKFHAKLIDGFTFTMPDTLKNQAAPIYANQGTVEITKTRLWTTDRTGSGHPFVSNGLRDGRRDWSV